MRVILSLARAPAAAAYEPLPLIISPCAPAETVPLSAVVLGAANQKSIRHSCSLDPVPETWIALVLVSSQTSATLF
eukprot:2985671-Pyramimonas_sp.AAC.1